MTSQEIITAIAKTQGFYDVQFEQDGCIIGIHSGQIVEVPNYVEDLNACHAAEITLTEAQYMKFGECITENVKAMSEPTFDECRSVTSANARQRAKAICRALGLWKD